MRTEERNFALCDWLIIAEFEGTWYTVTAVYICVHGYGHQLRTPLPLDFNR